MLYQLIIKILIGLSLLLCICSCDDPSESDCDEVQYYLNNDTNQNAVFLLFCNTGILDRYIDYDPLDTTIVNCFRHSDCCVVPARNHLKCDIGYDPLKKMFSSGQYIRVFISDMNDYYHPREWCKKDSYFVRYDISIEDARKLINGNGELEIHFPPDERMKDIKMWPKYEDVISEYGNISIDNENINSNVQ